MEKQKVLFLDRDGVVNEDTGYVHKIEDFRFMPYIFKLCRFFQSLGFKIIIITNQSGIARGMFTEADYNILTKHMVDQFMKNGIDVLDVFHCPDKDNCSFMRKPNPGMFLEAIKKYNIDVEQSINVGDKARDIEAGEKAGIMNNMHIDCLLKLLDL